MSHMIDDVGQRLSDDLYEKTRKQLNAFLEETNALLAAGDALNEDRTALAKERLADFLKQTSGPVVEDALQPPLTRVSHDVQNYVKAHPWVAIGAAAGVGLVVSLLLKRRH